MRYLAIDLDGTLRIPAAIDPVAVELPEGATRVPLATLSGDAVPMVTAWVSQDEQPLNAIGKAVLVALGAAEQDYHGVVLFTGWDPVGEQMAAINSERAWIIQTAHADAQAA